MNRTQVKKNRAKNSSKTIGIIIPSTTSNQKITVDDLIFFNIFVPSFLKNCSNTHYYNFFFGYDWDDLFYSKIENRDKMKQKFENMCPKIFTLTFVEFDEGVQKGDLSTMWTILADEAVKTNEYLYQLGDDIEFKTKGWEDLFITLLSKADNIGVVGPKDEGNITGILTQSFVHCTHLSIFKRYFPQELKNWYIDDWISEIYDSRVEKRIVVKNMGGKERYIIEKMMDEKDRIVKRDRELIQKIRSCKIMRFKNDKNFIFMTSDNCYIITKFSDNFHATITGDVKARYLIKFKNTPDIYTIYSDCTIKREKNYIIYNIEDETPIVKNIDNGKYIESKDPIFLIQQFYNADNKGRDLENIECLRRNIKSNNFESIFLLGEKIYSCEELGLEQIPQNLKQINIGKRIKYDDIISFGSKLLGYIVFSNCDIFFDHTIQNIRKSILTNNKTVQCLTRYEYRGENDLSKCKKYGDGETVCSQDSWVLHSSQLKFLNTGRSDFNLGHIGCDGKIANFFFENDFILLNEMEKYRTYHNHKNENRNFSNVKHLSKPWTFIVPTTKGKTNIQYKCDLVMNEFHLFWQYPAITEKEFWNQNKMIENYIGIPWATIIDRKVEVNIEKISRILGKNENMITCCQHISFRKMLSFFEKIGILKLYTPHKIKGENQIGKIKIYACPLYPVAIQDNPLIKNISNRRYLYSFKGAYMEKHYMSDVRKNIFSMDHPDNTYIENIGEWHFNRIVYSGSQNKNGDYNTSEKYEKNKDSYIDILSDSKFSLCPSGSGPNSIRFWESLGVGSIPILLSDTLDLPEDVRWSNAIIVIPERNVFQIPRIISEIKNEKMRDMSELCLQIFKDYSHNYRFSLTDIK